MAKSVVKAKKAVKAVSVKESSTKASGSAKGFVGIQKTDTLGEVINAHPEIAPVLAQAGLHCIGCHVSGFESIEQGCTAHGMSAEDVNELVKMANKRIADYEALPKVSFTENALSELAKRKAKSNFVRLSQVFGGDFDFEAVSKKEKEDVLIDAGEGKKTIAVLAEKRIERMLRGVKIDYDSKKKDFVANRE